MQKLKYKHKFLINIHLVLFIFLGLLHSTLGYSTLTDDSFNQQSSESSQNSLSTHHDYHDHRQQQHLFRHQHHQKKHPQNTNHNEESPSFPPTGRLEKAIDDFKKYQAERLKNLTDITPTIKELIPLRHHKFDIIPIDIKEDVSGQVKADQEIPITPFPLRTSNDHYYKSKTAKKNHHLRHHNRHHQMWEQRVFPALRHHQTTTDLAMATTTSIPVRKTTRRVKLNESNRKLNETINSRLFDRDGLYTVGPTSTDRNGRHTKYVEKENYLNSKRNLMNHYGHKSTSFKKLNDDGRFILDEISDFENEKQNKKRVIKKNVEKKRPNTKSAVAKSNDYIYDDDYDEDDDENIFSDEDDSNENSNRIEPKYKNHRINKVDSDEIYSRSYIPGTLTKEKFELLGTREAVQQSRQSYVTNQRHHQDLASQHMSKVSREASCGVPKPKVEKIQHDTTKSYVPHCTILHRCGDDTGCCLSDTKTCVAKKTQDVDLYFYVKTMGSKQGTIERLTFKNHTECHCVKKPKHHSSSTNFLLEPAMIRKATVLDCTCPKLFEKVLQDDGHCRCDCSSGNHSCDWLKRGMEHFSMVDRKCILEGRCKPPTCEFGNYVKKYGSCPKKDDKISSSYSSRSFH